MVLITPHYTIVCAIWIQFYGEDKSVIDLCWLLVIKADIECITAVYTSSGFAEWEGFRLPITCGFKLEDQIREFRNAGYSVDFIVREDRLRLVSVIPQNGAVTHLQWIMAYGDYLALHSVYQE